MIIGARGKEFMKEVNYLCSRQISKSDRFGAEKRLYMSIAAFPPDRRKRDLDNLGKSLADSLMHAGVYFDDSQIDHLEFLRKSVQKGDGRVIVIAIENKEQKQFKSHLCLENYT